MKCLLMTALLFVDLLRGFRFFNCPVFQNSDSETHILFIYEISPYSFEGVFMLDLVNFILNVPSERKFSKEELVKKLKELARISKEI